MKKILIVNKELPELKDNSRVVIKKNKTIIKDRNYFNNEFTMTLDREGIEFSYCFEEWEVWDGNRLQLVSANNGKELKPVHIVNLDRIKNGVRALFQSETMSILEIKGDDFKLTKNVLDSQGKETITTLASARFSKLDEIRFLIPKNFTDMILTIIDRKNKYIREGYLSP